MKTLLLKTAVYSLLIFLCNGLSICAQQIDEDVNKSPYFVVLSDDDEAYLPLKSTHVDVQISGVIADVTVRQSYVNSGKSTIEAIYVFPASTRAAVYDMVMKVGDREIRAVIEEKNKARNMYNQAKKKGKTVSLLEEERPNVFKMNVANIMPGATVEVNLSYTELLVPTDKEYEFVYPTVVGPRYVSKKEKQSQTSRSWVNNPYLKQGVESTSMFDIQVTLNAGIAIKQLVCETHKNKVVFTGKNSVTLALEESHGGNRDFIMQYKLVGNNIESGILLHEDPSGENYFLAMMQPPERVEENDIPAREYVFIVDVSGSMQGFPLDISKVIMKDILENLKEKDLFNIVFFAGGSEVYANESVPATKENITKAITYLNSTYGSGGTELLSALKTAMSFNLNEDYARSFVILTDGYVTVEKETFQYIRDHLYKANFFSFGIGTSVNRFIIEGIAHAGYGEAFVAENKNSATRQAQKFVKYISNPVLTNIKYHFDGIETYDVLPQQVPDLFADRPVIITGKYRGSANGNLIVNGVSGGKEKSERLEISDKVIASGKALKYLWAREKIRLLSDYNELGADKEALNEVVELSKKYNLLTEYTSFIAIDSIQSNISGNQKTIKQPIPLPKGVSNLSIVEDDLIIEDSECDEDCIIEFEVELEEEEADEVPAFYYVESPPEFPGGETALKKYLADNIKYPAIAQESTIQGNVYVSFTIDVDGSIIDVKVVRGVSPELDAEAIRLVKSMPKWKPAKQRGKEVKVSYTIPVKFTIV